MSKAFAIFIINFHFAFYLFVEFHQQVWCVEFWCIAMGNLFFW